jgi:hypothetical protein
MITVVASRYVAGDSTEGAAVGSLAAALAKRWPSDAHFQAGTTASGRRITRAALEEGVTMTAFAIDLDPPHHAADPIWSEATVAKLEALIAERGGVAHATRVGWRYVVALASPIVLRSSADWDAWRLRYEAACAELSSCWGLAPDLACSDPGRLFRLAFVVRDGQALEPRTLGDLRQMGAFELPPLSEDQRAAVESEAMASLRLAPAGRAIASEALRDSQPAGERGALFDLLDARGLIVRRQKPGTWIVSCPNAAAHSGSESGSSTILVEANSLGAPGMLICSHNACRHLRSARQWRRVIARLGGEKGAA